MNLCISGFGAGYLTAAPWVDEAKSLIATLEDTVFQTCNHAPPYVNNYSCWEDFFHDFLHIFFCSRIDLGVFFVQVTLDVWAAPGCPDPLAVPGVLYPNYIGAFCHKWFASRWSTCDLTQTTPRCCGLFNGGANAGRDKYPFPESLVFSCIFLFGRVLFFLGGQQKLKDRTSGNANRVPSR